MFFEFAAKITGVVESRVLRDARNGSIGRQEQFRGARKPIPDQVRDGRNVNPLSKYLQRGVFADVDGRRNIF